MANTKATRVEVEMAWAAVVAERPLIGETYRLYRLARGKRGPGWDKVRESFEGMVADAGASALLVRMEVLRWAA